MKFQPTPTIQELWIILSFEVRAGISWAYRLKLPTNKINVGNAKYFFITVRFWDLVLQNYIRLFPKAKKDYDLPITSVKRKAIKNQ